MKNWAILLLILNSSFLIAMESPDDNDNNSNKKLGLMFKTRDKKQLAMRASLILSSSLAKNNSNQVIDFPFYAKTFEKLKGLLESKSQLSMITKSNLELHEDLYAALKTRYPTANTRDIYQLIEAGLFLEVEQSILEACVHLYVKKKAKDKKEIDTFSKNIDWMIHKWSFLCVNSDYSLETDDFSVSWSEVEFFKDRYLEEKFYHRAPFRGNSISNCITLAGFHIDSVEQLQTALQNRKVFWNKVQRVDLMCNKLKEVSFLPKIRESVTFLSLTRNLITSLDLRNFFNLTELHASHNKLTAIPFLAGCSALKKLWLTNNKIKEIKEFDLLDLSNLEELQVSDNEIATIHPRALAGCASSLKVFDLSRNPITKLEFDLPSECALCIDKK